MFVRKTIAGVAAVAVAGSALVLASAPAHAADPDDTTFTPVAADLIGVGSDTSQHALFLLANAYNAQTPTPANRVANFAATGGGDITLPSGAIARPNGSGAGKATLYGAGNNADIDFARSSSALNTTEQGAGLQAFPFALDTLQMAVSASVVSNAPASLSPAQIVDIYDGDVTNWSQVGGSPGVIEPKIPQAGSGTRSFFVSQLKSLNGGVDVALAASVGETQEHDDTLVKNNPNAVAPFSVGRAALLGNTLRLTSGYKADRALYNVVRGADLAKPEVQAVFGSSGFFCSDAARELIEAAGFGQLARPEDSGVCGAATQSATTNFTLNEEQATVPTTTTLQFATANRNVLLTATVTAAETVAGSVEFFEGANSLGAPVTLSNGKAILGLTGVTPGGHTYRAEFTPSGETLEPSEDTVTGTVKTTSTIKESFPSSVQKGAKAKGTVTVTLVGVSAKATGKVKIKLGSKTLASKSLSGGKATFTLPALKKGKNSLKAVWSGNGTATGSTKSFTITQK
jgi:ABC-type phosphate transport system substrate-binding protein